jgi:hypothetical protein
MLYLGITAEVSDLLSTAISSDDNAQLAQWVLVKEASHKVCYNLSSTKKTSTYNRQKCAQCVCGHQRDCKIATVLKVQRQLQQQEQ